MNREEADPLAPTDPGGCFLPGGTARGCPAANPLSPAERANNFGCDGEGRVHQTFPPWFVWPCGLLHEGGLDAYARQLHGLRELRGGYDVAVAASWPASDPPPSGNGDPGSIAGSGYTADRPDRNHTAGKPAVEVACFWSNSHYRSYAEGVPREVLLPEGRPSDSLKLLGHFSLPRGSQFLRNLSLLDMRR